MAKGKIPKVIYGAVKAANEETYWTRIGVAFTNSDGSLNLKFDYIVGKSRGRICHFDLN